MTILKADENIIKNSMTSSMDDLCADSSKKFKKLSHDRFLSPENHFVIFFYPLARTQKKDSQLMNLEVPK